MGGGAWAGGVGGGEGGGKSSPGESTALQLPPDGPEHPTRPKRHHCDQVGGFPGRSLPIGALQRCQSVSHGLTRLQIHPHKSRPIESGHGRHAVQVAIKCS